MIAERVDASAETSARNPQTGDELNFFRESFETTGINTVQHPHVVYSSFPASVGTEVALLLIRLRI